MKWLLAGFAGLFVWGMVAATPKMSVDNPLEVYVRPVSYSTDGSNNSFAAWQDTANVIGWDDTDTYVNLSAIPSGGKKGGGTLEIRHFSQYLCVSDFTAEDVNIADYISPADSIYYISVRVRGWASVSGVSKFKAYLVVDGEIIDSPREPSTYFSSENYQTFEAFGTPAQFGFEGLTGADVLASNFKIAIVATNSSGQAVTTYVDGIEVQFMYFEGE